MSSVWDDITFWYDHICAANDYVSALNDLPPTYTIEDVMKVTQIIPDPETPSSIQRKLDTLRKAEAAWHASLAERARR